MMLYLSRAFVEFGPFSASELLSFQERGILKETDYVRGEGSEDWLHVNDWAATAKPAPPKKTAAKKAGAAAPAVKKPAAKKAKKA